MSGGGSLHVVLSVLVGKGPNCSTATQSPSCADELAVSGAVVQAVPFDGSGAVAAARTDTYGRTLVTVSPGIYTIEVTGSGAAFAPTAPIVVQGAGVTAVHIVGDTGIR